jgi:hypothetical protein
MRAAEGQCFAESCLESAASHMLGFSSQASMHGSGDPFSQTKGVVVWDRTHRIGFNGFYRSPFLQLASDTILGQQMGQLGLEGRLQVCKLSRRFSNAVE